MGWRDKAAERERRREREDRDLPASMRQASDSQTGYALASTVIVVLGFVGKYLGTLWKDQNHLAFWLLIAALVAAGLFAYWVSMVHRTQGREERRGSRAAESMEWIADENE